MEQYRRPLKNHHIPRTSKHTYSTRRTREVQNQSKNNISYLQDHQQEEKFLGVSLPQFPRFVSVMALAVLALSVVVAGIGVQNGGVRVAIAKSTLASEQNSNEAMKQEVAKLSSLSRIDALAKNELHMQKAEGTLVYTPSEETLKAQQEALSAEEHYGQ